MPGFKNLVRQRNFEVTEKRLVLRSPMSEPISTISTKQIGFIDLYSCNDLNTISPM
jgi:hypothetical protein